MLHLVLVQVLADVGQVLLAAARVDDQVYLVICHLRKATNHEVLFFRACMHGHMYPYASQASNSPGGHGLCGCPR